MTCYQDMVGTNMEQINLLMYYINVLNETSNDTHYMITKCDHCSIIVEINVE